LTTRRIKSRQFLATAPAFGRLSNEFLPRFSASENESQGGVAALFA